MIRIQNIPLPIGGGEEQLRKRAARLLGLNPGQLRSLTLARQSIDARKKSDVHYVCTCLLYTSPSPRDATLSRMPSSA